ncbi:hypothetical protein F5879DRAFT_927898, partial [Lentinula edodes]
MAVPVTAAGPAPSASASSAPTTAAPTPLSNDWSQEPDCFLVCRHTCPHPKANQPGGVLRWAFSFVRNVSTRGHEHIKSGKHPHCSQECPEFGRTRKGIEGLRDATVAEKFRATIMYSQAFHGSEVKNKAMLQWYDRVQAGDIFHGAWRGLFNSAPTFAKFLESAFSDGALGPPFSNAWAQTPRQYEDIPTHLNQNIRCFNLQDATAGNPAFGPGTQISTTPLILLGPGTTALTNTIPFPSSSHASTSMTISPIAPASTTTTMTTTDPAPAPSTPATTTTPTDVPVAPMSSLSLVSAIQPAYTFEMPDPPSLRPLHTTWNSQEKGLPASVLFVLSKVQAAKAPLKNLDKADEMVASNFYWCIVQWDLKPPHRLELLHRLRLSKLLQRYMYVEHSVSLNRANIYLFEWLVLALELNDAGVFVEFIDNDDFLEVLRKRERSVHWEQVNSVDLVLGRADLEPLSIPPQLIYTGRLKKTIELLSGSGIRFWP